MSKSFDKYIKLEEFEKFLSDFLQSLQKGLREIHKDQEDIAHKKIEDFKQQMLDLAIDRLASKIHKPMVKRRGVTIPQYQLKKKILIDILKVEIEDTEYAKQMRQKISYDLPYEEKIAKLEESEQYLAYAAYRYWDGINHKEAINKLCSEK